MLIDTATIILMQQIQTPVITAFSQLLSIAFEPLILILASLLIAIYLHAKKRKKESLIFLSTIITTGIIIKLLKEIIQRPRPLNALIQESTFAFPSGHTMMAVVFFGLIAFIFANKKHKAATITTTSLVVLLVAFTRLYLRVHWLTDIIGAITIGGAILTASIIILKKQPLT